MSEAEAHEDCSLRVRPRHRGTGPRPASVCGELGRSWSASPKSHLFPAAFRWQFAASLGDDTQETGRMKAQGRRQQAATTARVTRGRARLCQHRSPGEGGRDPGSCAGNGDLAFLRGSAATRWLTSPGRATQETAPDRGTPEAAAQAVKEEPRGRARWPDAPLASAGTTGPPPRALWPWRPGGREGGKAGRPASCPVSPRDRAGDTGLGTELRERGRLPVTLAHSPPRWPLPRELGRPRAGTTQNPGCRAARACPTP